MLSCCEEEGGRLTEDLVLPTTLEERVDTVHQLPEVQTLVFFFQSKREGKEKDEKGGGLTPSLFLSRN